MVYLILGGSRAHGRISSNAVRTLEDALADKPCNVYNSDVSVRLSKTRYTYPDVSVTCDERDQPTAEEIEVRFPRLIAEVLSDSAEAYDRGRKFSYYRACPTIDEYVLVASKYQAVEVYRRTLQGWTAYHAYGLGDEVELTSVGVRFPLAALYRNAGVPETTEAIEGEVLHAMQRDGVTSGSNFMMGRIFVPAIIVPIVMSRQMFREGEGQGEMSNLMQYPQTDQKKHARPTSPSRA